MDNITSLLHKFSKKSVDVQTIASANASNVPIAQAMFENRMTVAELVDSDWCSDIEVTDNGGMTTLVLFNGVAEKLLDTSAHKLVN
ncbi:hypothetical protein KY284_037567 [Solanum tuberosum]|nr:hypothetical protein KY284_037567 [Solanum tuberosum]